MLYSDTNDYGLIGYSLNQQCVFRLGSTNFIAGWSFDHQAIYTGTKNTTQHAFTEENSLTISPTGIRSNKWYIDSDGTAQFVGGAVKLNTDNAEMFGWTMKGDRFSTKHAALVSNSSDSGVYVSVADITNIASYSLRTTISNNGGIYMYSDGANALLRAYDTNGKLGFRLSTNGYHQIGSWNFDHESIYTGAKTLGEDGFTSITNAIILSINGLYGKKWKLLADGSGAIAGDNISWDSNGNVTLAESVSVSWSSVTGKPNLTKIDANGIYTGTISANNITAGTITTAAIKNGEYWALNTDGSGYLAAGNISWASDGSGSLAGGKIAWQTDGILRMTGWVQPTILEITDSNIHQYMILTDSYSYFDISKTGCLIYIKANLSSQGEYANTIWLPSIPGYLFPATNDEFNKTRTLLGATFSLYNFSTEEITLVSWDYTLKQADLRSWTVKPGHFVVLTCGMSTYTPSDSEEPLELIGWHGVTGKTWIAPI